MKKLFVPKKVAAMHDIAGFGRSSLTVVIPVISALGHQVCPVPTAVLSTITGFYEGYELIDLTDYMPSYLAHWEREKFSFDCIYTGFIASAEGCGVVEDFIKDADAPLKVIDPVFADNGKLYGCYDEKMVEKMRGLIKHADVITPNITEAAYLLHDTYKSGCEADWAKRLSELCGCEVVITGILSGDNVESVLYKPSTEELFRVKNPHIRVNYPGTGDLFASVLTGKKLCGVSTEESVSTAADFVYCCIEGAARLGIPARDGVPLELMLPRLITRS